MHSIPLDSTAVPGVSRCSERVARVQAVGVFPVLDRLALLVLAGSVHLGLRITFGEFASLPRFPKQAVGNHEIHDYSLISMKTMENL